MPEIFEYYKPLRNHLRRLPLIESLGVIRAHVQHFQFGTPYPQDVEIPLWFLQARSRVNRRVFEWELDTLSRELLIHADPLARPGDRYTLRRWAYFQNAIDKLKALENEAGGLLPKENIILELHRIAHRQFPWQRPPNATWLSRYYRIFSHPELEAILHRRIGLTARELFMVGLALSGLYLDQFALNYPPTVEIPGLARHHLDSFVERFGATIESVRTRAGTGQQLNENYPYVLNPLRVHPLVELDLGGRRALAAPIPTFLYWRFTQGVFYELVNERGFDNAYGAAFQQYVGDVLDRGNRSSRLSVYPETEYRVGQDRKDSVDWIVEDETGLLFVESKTKRLQLRAATEITTTEAVEAELDKLASFIVQLYKTIADYLNGHYPHIPCRPGKPIYPLVVTLEEWFTFGPRLHRILQERVAAKMAHGRLPGDWLAEMPYSSCSAVSFEKLVQVLDQQPIDTVMGRKARDGEFQHWLVDGFLSEVFPADSAAARDLFPETLDQLTVGELADPN